MRNNRTVPLAALAGLLTLAVSSAAGPINQPASAPSTKPAATRCQNGIANHAETSFIPSPRAGKGAP